MLLTQNLNVFWASLLFETLHCLGLQTVVVCPGSRSGPLAVAAAAHPGLEAIPILDERSAAFFALGLAQQQGNPVALACTSGTAAANVYPAIIEASLSHLPLMVLTADRPPELRACQAGQTIDQVHLYGRYVREFRELRLPDLALLNYLRQTLSHCWHRCHWPDPGPVHLNLPFGEPLAPVVDATFIAPNLQEQDFSRLLRPPAPILTTPTLPWSEWQNQPRGLIIAGPSHTAHPHAYGAAIARLSAYLHWPILADALSPLRHWGCPHVIAHYDLLLRSPQIQAALRPNVVLQLGPLPTSKPLREWLQQSDPLIWCLDPVADNNNPLHGRSVTLAIDPAMVVPPADPVSVPTSYLEQWRSLDNEVAQALAMTLDPIDWRCDAKLVHRLSQWLPADTAVFVASSMPVRDVESVWPRSDRRYRFYFNRGANGIDGTLSSALGSAHRGQPTVLLTGDLACLHDTNGWLITPEFHGSLLVLLINNHGGGIFEHLPIQGFEPPFERFFATPQMVSFGSLAAAYDLPYYALEDWSELEQHLSALGKFKVRLVEFRSDRHRNAQWRQGVLARLSLNLTVPPSD
ncbi:2-succinyl-5-enolpyruvyl-6-hydroxy-3-cyclohexene-1-carboxylic-acid synthase [Thermosynechococcaceae cyanobacterium Okahandja]